MSFFFLHNPRMCSINESVLSCNVSNFTGGDITLYAADRCTILHKWESCGKVEIETVTNPCTKSIRLENQARIPIVTKCYVNHQLFTPLPSYIPNTFLLVDHAIASVFRDRPDLLVPDKGSMGPNNGITHGVTRFYTLFQPPTSLSSPQQTTNDTQNSENMSMSLSLSLSDGHNCKIRTTKYSLFLIHQNKTWNVSILVPYSTYFKALFKTAVAQYVEEQNDHDIQYVPNYKRRRFRYDDDDDDDTLMDLLHIDMNEQYIESSSSSSSICDHEHIVQLHQPCLLNVHEETMQFILRQYGLSTGHLYDDNFNNPIPSLSIVNVIHALSAWCLMIDDVLNILPTCGEMDVSIRDMVHILDLFALRIKHSTFENLMHNFHNHIQSLWGYLRPNDNLTEKIRLLQSELIVYLIDNKTHFSRWVPYFLNLMYYHLQQSRWLQHIPVAPQTVSTEMLIHRLYFTTSDTTTATTTTSTAEVSQELPKPKPRPLPNDLFNHANSNLFPSAERLCPFLLYRSKLEVVFWKHDLDHNPNVHKQPCLKFMNNNSTFFTALDSLFGIQKSRLLFEHNVFPYEYVVMAGGACLHLLYPEEIPTNDIDWFVTGINERHVLSNAKACIKVICDVYGAPNIRIGHYKNVVTLWIRNHYYPIQLVLTKFVSCEELLHQMDLSICQIGIIFARPQTHSQTHSNQSTPTIQHQLVITPASLYSLATNQVYVSFHTQDSMNNVVASSILNSHNRLLRRIIKYYHRGFNICFPWVSSNLSIEDVMKQHPYVNTNTSLSSIKWMNDDNDQGDLTEMTKQFQKYYHDSTLIIHECLDDIDAQIYIGKVELVDIMGEFVIWSSCDELQKSEEKYKYIYHCFNLDTQASEDDKKQVMQWEKSEQTYKLLQPLVLIKNVKIWQLWHIQPHLFCIYTDANLFQMPHGYINNMKMNQWYVTFYNKSMFRMVHMFMKHLREQAKSDKLCFRKDDVFINDDVRDSRRIQFYNLQLSKRWKHLSDDENIINADEKEEENVYPFRLLISGNTKIYVHFTELNDEQRIPLFTHLVSHGGVFRMKLTFGFIVNQNTLNIQLYNIHL